MSVSLWHGNQWFLLLKIAIHFYFAFIEHLLSLFSCGDSTRIAHSMACKTYLPWRNKYRITHQWERNKKTCDAGENLSKSIRLRTKEKFSIIFRLSERQVTSNLVTAYLLNWFQCAFFLNWVNFFFINFRTFWRHFLFPSRHKPEGDGMVFQTINTLTQNNWP